MKKILYILCLISITLACELQMPTVTPTRVVIPIAISVPTPPHIWVEWLREYQRK